MPKDSEDGDREAAKAAAAEARRILPGLKDRDPNERVSTAQALSQLGAGAGPVAGLGLTAMALRDREPEVRQAGAKAIRELGQINRVLDALKGTRGGRLEKLRAAQAIAEMKESKQAVGALVLAAIRDPENDVRRHCMKVLVTFDQAELETAIPVWRRALHDVAVSVRRAAVDAFLAVGKICESDSQEALRVALHDSDWIVRRSAAEALAALCSEDPSSVAPDIAKRLRDSDWLVRRRAAESLGSIGAQSSPALTSCFKSETWLMPQTAAQVLGSMNRSKVDDIPMLTGALHNPSRVMRWRGAQALASLGQDAASAVQELTETLQDSDWTVRKTSLRALLEGGVEENPVQSLSTSLTHKDWELRERATRGLQALGKKARSAGGEDLEGSIHKHLRDPVRQVRWGTWRAMNTMRPNTRTPLPSLDMNKTL